MSFQHFNPGV